MCNFRGATPAATAVTAVLTLAACGPFGNSPAKSGATATSPAKTAPNATDFLVDGGISGAYVTPL